MTHEQPHDDTAREPLSGLAHGAIRAQLNRVLTSRDFNTTERVSNLLRFVVEETLAGRGDRLKGYTIATEIFGRGEDFDPAKDPIVRTQAGRLRQSLERFYLMAGQDDPVRIEIPKGRYIPLFVDLRAPAALATTEVVVEALNIVPAIAVLPLVDLSPDADQAFFVGGLSEELLVELNRYRDIAAVPCRNFAPEPRSVEEWRGLGAAMGARFFLGGSVRRDPEVVKAALHLVDSNSGAQIWSRSFRMPVEAQSLISTQEEIARDVIATVADQLGVVAENLSREARHKPPAEWATFEAMLHYHYGLARLDETELLVSVDVLEAALDREPDYGPAWAALGNVWIHSYVFGWVDNQTSIEQAIEYSEKGAELSPDDQLARVVRAFVRLLVGDVPAFMAEVEVALQLNPSSPYYVGMIGYLLASAGQFERGIGMVRWAIDVSRDHPIWFHHLNFLDHWRKGDWEDALQEVQMPGGGVWEVALRAIALHKLGRIEQSAETFEQLLEREPDFAARADRALGQMWRAEEVVEDLAGILREAGFEIGPYDRD